MRRAEREHEARVANEIELDGSNKKRGRRKRQQQDGARLCGMVVSLAVQVLWWRRWRMGARVGGKDCVLMLGEGQGYFELRHYSI